MLKYLMHILILTAQNLLRRVRNPAVCDCSVGKWTHSPARRLTSVPIRETISVTR